MRVLHNIHSFNDSADAQRKALSVRCSLQLALFDSRFVRELLVSAIQPSSSLLIVSSGEVDDGLQKAWGFEADVIHVPVFLHFHRVFFN